jgi:hypothetical protein
MSYSRWSNSIWYTFWTAFGATPTEYSLPSRKLKESQVFEICDFPSYFITYKDAKDNLDEILKDIKEYYSKDHPGKMFKDMVDGVPVYEDVVWPAKNPTDEEMEELRGYILQFIDDVDEQFMPSKWFMYQWYYPFRNKIIWGIRDLKKKWKKS